MKKIIVSIFSLMLFVSLLVSCDDSYTDHMTGDAKTGGLVVPTSAIPYKLGGTPSFDISVTVAKGPGIKSLEIYKTYTGKAVVLDRTVDVNMANVNDDYEIQLTYTYSQLSNGLSMPANELELAIGDAWTISYTAVMEDGRKVDNSSVTSVSVANKYAGFYQCVGTFDHPTAGVRDVNEEKYLTPIDANSCWANAGDLGSSGYFVKVTVDPETNQVTCSTWKDIEMANYPGEENYYDPATGEFHLSYYYVGSTGNRIMREVWTPIN
jgi:hypothetical protein